MAWRAEARHGADAVQVGPDSVLLAPVAHIHTTHIQTRVAGVRRTDTLVH